MSSWLYDNSFHLEPRWFKVRTAPKDINFMHPYSFFLRSAYSDRYRRWVCRNSSLSSPSKLESLSLPLVSKRGRGSYMQGIFTVYFRSSPSDFGRGRVGFDTHREKIYVITSWNRGYLFLEEREDSVFGRSWTPLSALCQSLTASHGEWIQEIDWPRYYIDPPPPDLGGGGRVSVYKNIHSQNKQHSG